jgi:hypothetical protein
MMRPLAGVEKLAGHRRRGPATFAVAGWALTVRSLRTTPFYNSAKEKPAVAIADDGRCHGSVSAGTPRNWRAAGSRYHHCRQEPHLVRRMNDMGTTQQARGSGGIAQSQVIHRRVYEFASPTFHILHLFQFGAAPAAGVGAIEHGAADRTMHHDIRFRDRTADRRAACSPPRGRWHRRAVCNPR